MPLLLLRRLAGDPAAPDPEQAPVAERIPAAVMFADISGYTKITEELAAQGPVGVERLSALLNTFFGRLIDRVRAHGGDVAKFAGDALVAVWPVGHADGGPLTALVRAAACALSARQGLHEQEIAPGVRLSLRVGLGVGEVVVLPVGGVGGRAELFVAGEAVVRAAQAEQGAPRGGVALSPEAAQLLRGRARARLREGDPPLLDGVDQPLTLRAPPLPPLTPALESALRAFVPAVVRSGVDAGLRSFEAELRRVSVLFVGLRRVSGEDPWRAHRAVVAIEEELERYEGAVHHLSVDEKGPALVAVFGLPPLAHEDDPARAALAALGVRAALGEQGISAALGVATGEIFCGSVGTERRREYTLIGATVVRAARLMQAAVAGVLCDATTWEAARDRVKFDPPRHVPMKGQERPVEAYAAVARRRLSLRPGEAGHALVGRHEERARLLRAVSALGEAGQGGVIAVEADHGFGKSHLVDLAVARARELGLPVLRGAAEAVEATTPYYPWRRALAFQLPSGGTAGDSMVLQAGLLQHLSRDDELLDRAPLLDALVPMGLAESALTRQLSGEARAAATRDLILRLMHRMSGGRPLVIVLEDVHWMDSASWALAVAASRRLRPILLIFTMRPVEEAPPAWAELRSGPAFQKIRLGPLKPEEVAALICQQLDVEQIPGPVLELVHQRAAGHPQLSLELVYALRDAGVIRVSDGRCRLALGRDLSTIELPETVAGLVRSRIDQLPEEARLVLKVASVIGRSFPLRMLAAILPVPLDRARLHQRLDELTRASMLEPVAGAAEPCWAFKDAITQQVACNLMLQAQRRPLHRALAERYEDTHPAERAGYTALLAFHWREAGEPAAAVPWLERAGEQALGGGAWREAAGFFAEALRMAEEAEAAGRPLELAPLAKARWRRCLGRALVQSGRLAEGSEALEGALQALGWPLPRGEGAQRLALVLALAGLALAGLLPRRTLEGPAAERGVEALRASEILAEMAYFDGQARRTFLLVLRAAALARRLPPCPELARAEASLALCWAAVPLPTAAQRALRRAAALAEGLGDAATAWVSLVQGQISAAVARWEPALEALERAARLNRALGDQRHLALGQAAAALVHYHRGEDALAMAAAEEVEAAGERCGDASFLASSYRVRAMVLTRQQRPVEALAQLERALALPDLVPSRATEIASLGERALALWRAGLPEEAVGAAREVGRVAGLTRPTAAHTLSGLAGAAEVLLAAAAGGERALQAEAARAVRRLERLAAIYPLARPEAGLRRGQLLHLRGQPRRAARRWAAALREAERLAMPMQQVALHLALGREGPEAGRAGHLAAAERVLGSQRTLCDERTLTGPPTAPPPRALDAGPALE